MTLVNFIAVEPIVEGKRGLGELELSSVIKQDRICSICPCHDGFRTHPWEGAAQCHL